MAQVKVRRAAAHLVVAFSTMLSRRIENSLRETAGGEPTGG